MKTIKILAVVFVLAATAAPAFADDFGLGAALFDGDYFGLQGRKTFDLGGDISEITTGATIYFKDTWFAIDADYHFTVNPENPSRFYPLVGLNVSTDFDWAEVGANLGGGVDFMITDTLPAYFEAKYTISDLDGFTFILGLKF